MAGKMMMLLFGLSGFSQLAGAADNLHFSGALVAEPCVIPPGKETVELNFGSVVDKYLYANQRTPGERVEITLADCDLSLGKAVRVTLNGTESAVLPGLLKLAPGSGASGVAIGLETPAGDALPINLPGGKLPLTAGANTLRLMAYVRGEPEAIAKKTIGRGAFNAVVTFSLAYE
ncbi:type 1 fimbrial protein [Serratia ureilytica]|uniref:fimbrial protein n=1 Tax=Serratia TaxID=613 RepID=UPI000E3BAA39|nr:MULTISPECIES: fimbrial protein [Serratia]MBH3108755.1 type 1 fimbrial protein [Serratia ureilytica]MBH3123681.1 type 1 fimbrial protein [Serratia ureilytica]MBH3156897.1 type 1 fimbrial protein [Serratia ureilytica]MBH3252009.1 type 1 fimbrial protein [Serratia ureilytica]RFS88287.1 exotoxin [Serratia marcescens]